MQLDGCAEVKGDVTSGEAVPKFGWEFGAAMGSWFKDRSFIGYALTVCFILGGSFAYVAGTPFVYEGIYGVSPQVFSVLFGVNGLFLHVLRR